MSKANTLPLLAPMAPEADPAYVAELRRFHLGIEAKDAAWAESDSAQYWPALLWPYRDESRVRSDYPLLIPPVGVSTEIESLADVSRQRVPDSARILHDNLPRFEVAIRRELGSKACADAKAVIESAALDVEQQLSSLSAEQKEELRESLAAFASAIPAGSTLVGHTAMTSLYVVHHAATARVYRAREKLRSRLEGAVRRLRERMSVDEAKSTERRAPEALGVQSGAAAAQYIDFGRLAQVVGQHRGTQSLSPERRKRIEQVLETLTRAALDAGAVSYVSRSAPPIDLAGAEFHKDPRPIAAARALFEQTARAWAKTLAALRVAELELASPSGSYDAARHDPWFAAFDWQAFGPDELAALPAIIVFADEPELDLGPLSKLLLSGYPIGIIARVAPADPRALATEYHRELGYLGISQRQAYVSQTSTSTLDHLLHTCQCLVRGMRAGLMVIPSEGGGEAVPSRLRIAAAVEGRAHPLFSYDPDKGRGFAERFEFAANPSTTTDWPESALRYMDDEGHVRELASAFTFADFAVLEPSYRSCFRVVTSAQPVAETLAPIETYLAFDDDAQQRHLPFVWAVDADGNMVRLVMSRALVLLVRDRLQFWQTVQELGGVQSAYVQRAVSEAGAAAEQRLNREIERLEAAHREALAKVRDEAVTEAMDALARSLLDLDGQSLAAVTGPASRALAVASRAELTPAASPEPAKGASPASSSVSPEAAPAPVDDDEEEEAWIDSVLCTSCNDCINLNQQLFAYNGNKQAEIRDLSAGTYADMVTAAEKCPAHCIHPGAPQNPTEPGLDELKARARALKNRAAHG